MFWDQIEFGIRVNAVSPGAIDTDFHKNTPRELLESWRDSIPVKKLGFPQQVASVIYFLTSEEASYLVGEVIQINGGQMML
jgi:NAD(P)-dependent dehydrogenase (short-subunit alcohol dehydrogenase family)